MECKGHLLGVLEVADRDSACHRLEQVAPHRSPDCQLFERLRAAAATLFGLSMSVSRLDVELQQQSDDVLLNEARIRR